MKRILLIYALLAISIILSAQNASPTISLLSIKSTNNAKYITAYTAVSGATVVTSDGGATNTSRGVCWSIWLNPTINDAHTYDGTGDGNYISVLYNLLANTLYHVRSYQIYSENYVVYGPDLEFTTNDTIPALSCMGAIMYDATPTVLEVIYNYKLNNDIYNADAYTILINNVETSINSVNIIENKVYLTLSNTAYENDSISVAYQLPLTNPLQSIFGDSVQTREAFFAANLIVDDVIQLPVVASQYMIKLNNSYIIISKRDR